MNVGIFFCTSNAINAIFIMTINGKMSGVIVIDNTVNAFTVYDKNGEITCAHTFPFITSDFRMKREFILTTLNTVA